MMMDGTCAFINCRTSRDLGVGSSCKCVVDDGTEDIAYVCAVRFLQPIRRFDGVDDSAV